MTVSTQEPSLTYRQRASANAFLAWSYVKLAIYQVVYVPAKVTAGYALWVAKKAGPAAGFIIMALVMYMVGVLMRAALEVAKRTLIEHFEQKLEDDPVFALGLATLWCGGVVATATWAFFWVDESVDQYLEGIEEQLADEEILVDAADTSDDD